jgi:sodium/pantothenate symporter
MDNISATSPQMLEPLGGGSMPLSLYFTQWLLVGVFTFCLPQSVVRCMGFKDERSLKNAMVMGTVIIGIMMIAVTALGVLCKGIMPGSLDAYGGSVDNIIPYAIANTLPGWLAGIAIIGPIAASISTVSSLLISSSSSIIKDVYLHYRGKSGKKTDERHLPRMTQVFTLAVGLLVFALAVVPPEVIWKINMFAFGGLETAFCWVLVMGLYWKRANKMGALLSMSVGAVVYCLAMAIGFKPFGLHQIVIGISVSLLMMVIGSLLSKKGNPHDEVFFPA